MLNTTRRPVVMENEAGSVILQCPFECKTKICLVNLKGIHIFKINVVLHLVRFDLQVLDKIKIYQSWSSGSHQIENSYNKFTVSGMSKFLARSGFVYSTVFKTCFQKLLGSLECACNGRWFRNFVPQLKTRGSTLNPYSTPY
jgi:hypothetical protein